MPTPNDDFTTETHAGQQTVDDGLLLDAAVVFEVLVCGLLGLLAAEQAAHQDQPPDNFARALERFESRLAAGEWPTRPDGHTAASAPTVQEIRRQLRQLANPGPPDPTPATTA